MWIADFRDDIQLRRRRSACLLAMPTGFRLTKTSLCLMSPNDAQRVLETLANVIDPETGDVLQGMAPPTFN